jgi:MYXO-CTERM domain-containing protein
MRNLLAFTLGAGLLATPALAAVDPIVAEICPACTSIVLTGNADFQATGGRNFIDFAPQATGSALATFAGLPIGGNTFIDIVGQDNNGSNFDFVLNTTTNLGVFSLGGFDKAAVDVTFSFIAAATTGSLLITSTGGNFEGKIDLIGIRTTPPDCPDCTPTPVGLPGPIAGVGLLPLFAMGGFGFWRRRRARAA